jgi:hypothetical protein
MNFHLVHVSENAKIGKISVTYTSNDSCPSTCSLKGNGCYGEMGPISMFWKKVSDGKYGTQDFDAFCKELKTMNGLVVRLNVVGDLPHTNGYINGSMIKKMVVALKKKVPFTYTHHNMEIPENREIVKMANENGLTINLSADNMKDADTYMGYNIGPVVTTMPANCENVTFTPNGNKIVKCPAAYKDNVTCQSCMLCAKSNRKVIIGFPAHGSKKKSVEAVFNAKSIS